MTEFKPVDYANLLRDVGKYRAIPMEAHVAALRKLLDDLEEWSVLYAYGKTDTTLHAWIAKQRSKLKSK